MLILYKTGLIQNLSKQSNMSLVTILLNIFLPPIAVALKHGVGGKLLVNILLCILGWLPGVIHAFYVNGK